MTATGRTDSAERGGAVRFYGCAGGINVARISYRACRQLQEEGLGEMGCLAPLAAGIEEQTESARQADLNVVVDGCELQCGRRVLDGHDIKNYVQIKVTDLGIAPSDEEPATEEQVAVVVRKVKEKIGKN